MSRSGAHIFFSHRIGRLTLWTALAAAGCGGGTAHGSAAGGAAEGGSGGAGRGDDGPVSGSSGTSSGGSTGDDAANPSSDASSGDRDGGGQGTPTGDSGGGGQGTTTGDSGGGEHDAGGEAGGTAERAFSQCRFHFGTIDSIAEEGGASLISQLDSFTSGWLGQNDTAPDGTTMAVCKEGNMGGALADQTPALVSYIIAYAARRHACLSDCNATNAIGQNGCTAANSSDLCTGGAAYIRNNFPFILGIYQSYAQALASCYGTTRPMIWKMEPDYFQYYDAAQNGDPLTVAEAASYMTQIMTTVRKSMPNALFSLDISPWMPNNGADWYPAFDLGMVSFISTSGGDTDAASTLIRTGNSMTWAGVHQVTGKPILADTGYGAAGESAGPDPNWDNPTNINARIADGVISITQYNPDPSTWGATIAADRPQLSPVGCY